MPGYSHRFPCPREELLRRSQEEQVRLAQEITAARTERLKSGLSTNATPSNQAGVAVSFQDAVLSVADQEDAAFLTVDNYVTELSLVSYSMFNQEFEAVRSARPTDLDGLRVFIAVLMAKPIEYRNCAQALQGLRIQVAQKLLQFYRQKLTKFESSSFTAFLSDIRQKPPILTDLGELVKGLKSNENPTGWNTNATKIVGEFVSAKLGAAELKPQNTPR